MGFQRRRPQLQNSNNPQAGGLGFFPLFPTGGRAALHAAGSNPSTEKSES